MSVKILSPMLFLAVVSLFIPPAEAASSFIRWPGASCQSIDNSSDISFNTAGTALNNSTTAAHTVICPVQMPVSFIAGDTINVTVRFVTSVATVCALRLADHLGTTHLSDSGTSSSSGNLILVIQNNTGNDLPHSANLRCALPAAGAFGAQGVVSYLIDYSD